MANIPTGTAPGSTVANIPTGGAPPPGLIFADQPDMPLGTMATPAPVSTGVPGGAVVVPKPVSITETHHDKTGRKSPGLLEKLKGSGGTEKLKTSTVTPPPGGATIHNIPSGPPITSEVAPPPTPGKGTRFSDTAHLIPSAGAQDVIENEHGQPILVPATESKTSNKLKKKPDVVTTPGMPPPGTVLGDGTTVPLVPPSRPGSTAPAGFGGAVPIPPAKQAEIPILDEIILPDGTKAYIRRGTAPAAPASVPVPAPAAVTMPTPAPATLSKKDKSKEKIDTTADVGATSHTHIPTESEMGRGHCSMCCPSAPRDASGRPIYPCAHQDGLSGPSAMDRAQAAAGNDKGKNKKGTPPAVSAMDIPLPPGGDTNTVVVDATDKPAGGNKLVKGGGGKGGSGASPEEMAMDDARKLAGTSYDWGRTRG